MQLLVEIGIVQQLERHLSTSALLLRFERRAVSVHNVKAAVRIHVERVRHSGCGGEVGLAISAATTLLLPATRSTGVEWNVIICARRFSKVIIGGIQHELVCT